MLRSLSISNYALIDSIEINFPAALILITGETGAGKSILMGALSLLRGGKADASVIKDKERNCVVEAEFEDPQEDGHQGDQGGTLIIRRVVSPSGRSRCFINDEPVALAQLSEKMSQLVDIHAQHQHLLLSDASYQLSVLDYFSGTKELLSAYRAVYDDFNRSRDEIKRVEDLIQKNEADRDYVAFQFEQLDSAQLKAGEIQDLEQEQKTLANADSIRENLSSALAALEPMGQSVSQNLKEASSLLSKSSKHLEELEELSSRLSSCKIEIDDIHSDLARLEQGVLVDPRRLEQVDERLSLLYSLLRKHSVTDIEELIELRDSLDSSLSDSGLLEETLKRLVEENSILLEKLQVSADALSKKRRENTMILSQTLTASIQSLEMPKAELRVEVSALDKFTPNGRDGVEFLFSANATSLVEISKAASGGELSRVMLSLKALMAKYAALPTMIFDEIDTGVSGKVADKMGDMIANMALSTQIIAITHLPQIASKKATHYYVYKEFNDQNIPQTMIKKLDESERITELAKMLSGSKLTDAALENARVLFEENNK